METFHYTNQPPQQPALEKKSFHAQEFTRIEAKKMLQAMLEDNFSSWGTFEGLVKMHKQLGSDLLHDSELVSLTQALVEQLHEIGDDQDEERIEFLKASFALNSPSTGQA
jgi:hypothetical protein